MIIRNAKIIAAASLAIFAGAAAADERQIDYTNMNSSTTRAEVVADTMAFDNMNDGLAQEAYGSVDKATAMTSDTSREAVMAEARDFRINNSSLSYVSTNEAYNGFPALDRNLNIALGAE